MQKRDSRSCALLPHEAKDTGLRLHSRRRAVFRESCFLTTYVRSTGASVMRPTLSQWTRPLLMRWRRSFVPLLRLENRRNAARVHKFDTTYAFAYTPVTSMCSERHEKE